MKKIKIIVCTIGGDQPGQKYHPFHSDSVKINDLLLTLASKFLLQIARFQLRHIVTDGETSISGWGSNGSNPNPSVGRQSCYHRAGLALLICYLT